MIIMFWVQLPTRVVAKGDIINIGYPATLKGGNWRAYTEPITDKKVGGE